MQGSDPDAVEILSRDRLDGFRDKATDSDKTLVGRYLLNAAIAEALHPLLHGLEVILRNRINEAASARYPIDADLRHEYADFPCWIDAVNGPVSPHHQKLVADAKGKVFKELRRRYGPSVAAARRMHTPGRLVAALPFGFWVYLFDPEYSGTRASPGTLWPELLPDVFPHGRQISLKTIRARLRHLLVLRNRVMHYERIFPYNEGKGLPWDPQTIQGEILELVAAMSPRAAGVLQRFERVSDVMHPLNLRYLRWIPWLY